MMRKGKAGRLALRRVAGVFENIAGAIDREGAYHHAKTTRSGAGLVDRAAQSDVGIWQIDHAADVPGWAVEAAEMSRLFRWDKLGSLPDR